MNKNGSNLIPKFVIVIINGILRSHQKLSLKLYALSFIIFIHSTIMFCHGDMYGVGGGGGGGGGGYFNHSLI